MIIIQNIVFDCIRENNGVVDLAELTRSVLKERPDSKWDISHWRWYKSQIVSPNGKYHDLFSRQIVANLLSVNLKTRNNTQQQANIKTGIKINHFSDLSNKVDEPLAVILGKVAHHIHPDIVNYISRKNEEYRSKFESISPKQCNLNSFLYKKSDCVFPGVRRPLFQGISGLFYRLIKPILRERGYLVA